MVKSLINIKNNDGPKLLPWGTPDKLTNSSGTTLSILTLFSIMSNESAIVTIKKLFLRNKII